MTASDPHPRKRVAVLDSEMSYVDVGEGKPVVFLHGNPTSSYLWRNIIPHVSDIGRCLAPDLVGMGRSGRSKAILVVHDWGSALGFRRAYRHPGQIAAIAYVEAMEAIVKPLSWGDFGGQEALSTRFDRAKGNTLFWTRTSSSKQYCQGRSSGPLARRRWRPIGLLTPIAKRGCRR